MQYSGQLLDSPADYVSDEAFLIVQSIAVEDLIEYGGEWAFGLHFEGESSATMVPERFLRDLFLLDDDDDDDDVELSEAYDPMLWVLIHDAGTADETVCTAADGSTIVCFKDEAAATRCHQALQQLGGSRDPTTQCLRLQELIERLSLDATGDIDICLIDTVVESSGGGGGLGPDGEPVLPIGHSAASRALLKRVYEASAGDGDADFGV